jgi:uncharacterized protein (DUF58 family)
MLQPSLHPEPKFAACEPRLQLVWTRRKLVLWVLGLLTMGCFWLIPGRLTPWMRYLTLLWDGAVLFAMLIVLVRQPKQSAGEAKRLWVHFDFGLTARALVLLGLGFLWLIPGYYDTRLAYGMLAWDGLILLAAIADGLRLPRPGSIELGREWLSAPSLGNRLQIELSARQDNGLVLECEITDDLPAELIETPAPYRMRVYPRVAAKVRYSLFPKERGDVEAGALYLRYRSALGLVSRWAKAPVGQRVRIYPELRTAEDQQLFLAKSRQIEQQLRLLRQRGLGREFESLREYRPGDDLRDVCWTASARRGELVTRQFQAERSQSVWIVLDTGRLLRARVSEETGKRASRYTKLDFACSTAVALAQLALYSGDRVGLLGYGRRIQQQLLPARGPGHMRVFLDALAQLQPEGAEADHLRATAILGRLQPRRALILWITDLAETAMRPEVIDGAAQLLHRHVVLFVAMAQPEVAAIARVTPGTVEEMFRSAAAQEMASRRELLLARLRDQGAITLDTLPGQMTAAVLNQYLSIKERAVL